VCGKYTEITITSRTTQTALTATACHKSTYYSVIREASSHQHGVMSFPATFCAATNSPSAWARHSPSGVPPTEVSRRRAGCRTGTTKDTNVLDPCNSDEISGYLHVNEYSDLPSG
jgi:hypothetical protein